MTITPPNSNNQADKSTSNTDGLPDIAQNKNKNLAGASLIFVAIIVLGACWLLQQHYRNGTTTANEETFTIEKGTPAKLTPAQKVETQQTNNQSVPSEEMVEAQKA